MSKNKLEIMLGFMSTFVDRSATIRVILSRMDSENRILIFFINLDLFSKSPKNRLSIKNCTSNMNS